VIRTGLFINAKNKIEYIKQINTYTAIPLRKNMIASQTSIVKQA